MCSSPASHGSRSCFESSAIVEFWKKKRRPTHTPIIIITIMSVDLSPRDGGSSPFKGRKNAHGQYNFQPSPPHTMSPLQPAASSEQKRSRRRKHIPFLISILIIANIAVFIVTMYYNNCPVQSAEQQLQKKSCILPWLHRFSFQPWHENPLLGPSAATLRDKMGGLQRSLVISQQQPHHHQVWRLVSCIWLHAGLFHLLAHILALLLVGIPMEMEFGALRIGVIYLLSGIGGSLLSALFLEEDQVSVGASGALFGLLGATLAELITNWSRHDNSSKCASLVRLLLLLFINLALGLMPFVDNFAHIGGFLAGFLLGFAVLMRVQKGYKKKKKNDDKAGSDHHHHQLLPYLGGGGRGAGTVVDHADVVAMIINRKYKVYQIVCMVASVILLVGLYAAACATLFTGINASKNCSWCHYLDCVPTSKWQC